MNNPNPIKRHPKPALACLSIAIGAVLLLNACQGAGNSITNKSGPKVLVVESFLADIAQNVAGDRLQVETLIPLGVDPHAFEPTPRDIASIADCDLLIANGAGLEEWLNRTMQSAGGHYQTVEASAGLTSRARREGEAVMLEGQNAADASDPHFWLNPLNVVRYVENIRDGLTQVDPQGKDIYAKNAAAFIAQLKDLDSWIQQQVQQIPSERRKMVTNHESFGYFADRYGFEIIGTVIPNVSSVTSPSAQQLARLVDAIKASQAPAIFLETGSNQQLAGQLSQETGIKVVTGLYTHSITSPDGAAPTYLEMMRQNTKLIVEALKP